MLRSRCNLLFCDMFISAVKSTPNEDISILIQPTNHSWYYACDCGEASGYSIKEYQNTKALFISHTHIDHFIHFDQFLRHQIGTQHTVVICGPQHIAKQVQARIKGFTWNLIAEGAITYEIREIVDQNTITVYELQPPFWELKEKGIHPENKIYKNKIFEVDFTILNHKTASVAYRFKEYDFLKMNLSECDLKPGPWIQVLKDAFEAKNDELEINIDGTSFLAKDLYHFLEIKRGDTLGVILDHAANTENHTKIKNKFTDCNTVYIECFYKDEDKEYAAQNYHSYASASGKIMQECNVKDAIPVHFSRKYTADEINEIKTHFFAQLSKL